MVERHKSIGPEVGSSGGKNILFLLPTFFGKIQSTNFFSARKKPQKTKPALAKLFFSEKTTNQIRKNLMHKNAIFFSFSALVSLLTLMCILVNPSTSGNFGKIRKNRNSQFANFSTENKNSKEFESDKNQPKKCLHDPHPKKNQEKFLPSPPISKS